MFHWAQTRRAAAIAIKLAFQVTALGNLKKKKTGCVAAVVDDCGCTHTHIHTRVCGVLEKKMDRSADCKWHVNFFSVTQLTAEASAINIKGHGPQPSRLSTSYLIALLLLPPSSSRRVFQGQLWSRGCFIYLTHAESCLIPPLHVLPKSPG